MNKQWESTTYEKLLGKTGSFKFYNLLLTSIDSKVLRGSYWNYTSHELYNFLNGFGDCPNDTTIDKPVRNKIEEECFPVLEVSRENQKYWVFCVT